MTHSIQVPLTGPPVSHVPKLDHECKLSGLRIVALPPGKVEVSHVTEAYVLDVNLHPVRHEIGVNSDRLERQTVPAESVGWAPPQTELRLKSSNADWGVLLELEPSKAGDLLAEAVQNHHALPSEFTNYLPAPQAAQLARHLIRHMRFGVPDHLFVEGMSLAILSCAFNVARSGSEHGSGPATTAAEVRIARAIDYAEAHLAEPLTMAELAAIACMSPWHFARCFKATTGDSPHKWVMRRRTERAIELIRFTGEPLAEIAHRCGFSSQSHMGAAVKSTTGTTPAALRND